MSTELERLSEKNLAATHQLADLMADELDDLRFSLDNVNHPVLAKIGDLQASYDRNSAMLAENNRLVSELLGSVRQLARKIEEHEEDIEQLQGIRRHV